MHKTLNIPDGNQITFDIRASIFLLIQTSFDPINDPVFNTAFWEKIPDEMPGLKSLDAIGNYDDKTGYVIYVIDNSLFTKFQPGKKSFERIKSPDVYEHHLRKAINNHYERIKNKN